MPIDVLFAETGETRSIPSCISIPLARDHFGRRYGMVGAAYEVPADIPGHKIVETVDGKFIAYRTNEF